MRTFLKAQLEFFDIFLSRQNKALRYWQVEFSFKMYCEKNEMFSFEIDRHPWTNHQCGDVLVFLNFYKILVIARFLWSLCSVDFFCCCIEIAYSNFTFCGAKTPSLFAFRQKMWKFQKIEHTLRSFLSRASLNCQPGTPVCISHTWRD